MTKYYAEQRLLAYDSSGGVCEVCGKPLCGAFEAAHVIPRTKRQVARFGSKFIDSAANLKAVCPTSSCNVRAMLREYSADFPEHVNRVYQFIQGVQAYE